MTVKWNRRQFLKHGRILAGGLVLGCSYLCGCSNLQTTKEKGKTMDKMIAYCGLRCDTCPILQATRETDYERKYEMRAEIARQIKKHYGRDCKPEDVVDCDGCKAKSGRLFSSCSKCLVRKCASQKGVETCAHCDEYACDKLEKLFSTEPGAKESLEEIRKDL